MKIREAAVAAAAVVLLAACGGANAATGSGATTANAPVVATAPAAAATVPAAAPATPAATPAAGTVTKVSANTATRAQMQAAFQAAGIPNAARMAMEVEEYRPYPTDDPGFAKLRKELAKYNIAADVVDKIVATLTV
ncbi:MAG TPA: hypothetical protein VGM69_12925 [Chloroflexota bacterium]|jgi:hypothetical protein